MAASPLRRLVLTAAVLFVAAPVHAQQAQDSAYARMVREHTTDARFLPPSVATLPVSASVPSPLEHFGTIIGAPGVMHRTSEIYGYYRRLAETSPRVRVENLGESEEGREILLVVIADEPTMGRLEHHRAQMALLADPRRLPSERLEEVLADVKPIYYLNGGLHSPEMGSPEMLMELAYRLAVSDAPAIRKIRDELIVLINPVSEPDGRDKQVDWYHAYTKGRERWDDGFPRSSPYWGRYVYHDNNRDGLQISQALTKAIYRAYYDWHPVVMHDLHESVPLLYVSTGTGPYNPTADPIQVSEWQLLANADLTTLSAEGLPGVWTWAFFDGWWPGYAIWVANNHNAVGRFYETFGNAGADTYVRDLSNARYAGDPVTERTWYRAWPPTEKVRWSSRNNTNYMQAGVLASLGFVADNPRTFLRNFWQKGSNSIMRGVREAPHAYLIPALERQRDPKAAAYLINQLLRQEIEIHRVVQEVVPAAVPDTAGAGDAQVAVPAADTLRPRADDFVIRLDQPYRDLAVSLLSEQRFPSDADHPPYDDIAWTLPLLYGVEVRAVDDSAALAWPGLQPVTDTVAARAHVRNEARVYAMPYRAQMEALTGLYWLQGRDRSARVRAVEVPFKEGVDSFPAGSLLLEGVRAEDARALAERFALPLLGLAAAPDVPTHAVDLPRVAIYHTWYNTQDEGWARYTFEQRGVPYTSIDKDDLRGGGLRRRFDVIVVPAIGGDVEMMIHGVGRAFGPIPFRRSAETPALGTPDASDDITGGPGFAGLAELQRFVEEGGTLVTLEDATRLAVGTGIARPLNERPAGGLFHPGSVVRARALRPEHPVLYGYPEVTTLFRGNAALFQVANRDKGMALLQYGPKAPSIEEPKGVMMGIPRVPPTEGAGEMPGAEAALRAAADSAAMDSAGPAAAGARGRGGEAAQPYVVSGMVRNESQIVGQGALFDVPVGQGRVLAFTFNPLHRFLNHHEFPLVWNALMHWNDFPPVPPADEEGRLR